MSLMARREPAAGHGKTRVTVWLSDHTLRRLRDTARTQGRTQAEIVEAGVLHELGAPSVDVLAATVGRLAETVETLVEKVSDLERRFGKGPDGGITLLSSEAKPNE